MDQQLACAGDHALSAAATMGQLLAETLLARLKTMFVARTNIRSFIQEHVVRSVSNEVNPN